MTDLRFIAMPTADAHALQAGAADANGQTPERHVSDGDGVFCRYCLADVARGAPYLILAYRPFQEPQPYAEVGPIFLHAEPCPRHDPREGVPAPVLTWERLLIRGYGSDDRILYGTGQVVAPDVLASAAARLFERPEIAYVHIRSATNNCYQCRVERD